MAKARTKAALQLPGTAAILIVLSLLSACGGGSGSGSNPGNASHTGNTLGSSNGATAIVDRTPTADPVSGQTDTAASTTITFMHMNDLHAHLTPHPDLVADGNGGTRVEERGGLARLATLIQRIRKDNPHSVLMNVGDTFHGGAEAMFTLGNAIVDPVNALGIDVGVPGNWDFGYSSIVFRLRYTNEHIPALAQQADPLKPRFAAIKKPNFPNLAANMRYKIGNREVLPATLMKDINGVKTGFIGITSDIVKFVYPLLAPGFTFTGEGLDAAGAEAAYRDLINRHAAELRSQGANIVVVMSELGIHKDHRLAQVIKPGSVDVFFSAHTHEATFEPLTSASGALVVEAGNDGYLGRMDIEVSNGTVTARNWTLLPIDRHLASDPKVAALVRKARAPFNAIDVKFSDPMPNSLLALVKPLNTVVGHTDFPLDRRNALQSSFNNAIGDILRHYGKTDLAMVPGFRFDSVVASGALLEDNTLASGDITLEDIYRFYPIMFGIASGEIRGAKLKAIIEDSLTRTYSTEPFKHKGGWLEGWSGLSMTVNLANPDGKRILDLRLKDSGEPIRDEQLITVTGCKRPIEPRDKLCRQSGFENVQPLFLTGTGEPWTIIDLLIEGVSTGVVFDPTRRDMVDLNSTPAWPDTPFVQPLEGAR